MPKRFIDKTGERFGRLVVLRFDEVRDGARHWLCLCDCGKETSVNWKYLSSKQTRSCGCWWREILAAAPGRNKKAAGESSLNNMYSQYQRSAKARGHEWNLPRADFLGLVAESCWYCGVRPAQLAPASAGNFGVALVNGIDRIDNAQGYVPNNVRACCKQCNRAKGILSESEFTEWVYRIANRLADIQRKAS